MRDKEFIDLANAYKQIYNRVQIESVEEVDNYDQILEYLLSEGYSKEESDQIMIEIINEAGLGSLIKGAKAVAGFVAKRAKTPLRTAATDSLITSTALNPVSTAKVAKTIAKSAPSPAPIVRTVKATPVRTAPKGANKITTNVWNEPTAPSSRISPSKPSGPKVSSTRALSGTPSRPALPSAGKTTASVKAPKPTFKPEALPKVTKSAEPAGALVRTKAPKPTFKPEALPKVTKSTEPGGALVSTRAPKPTFKPEALPKATKSAEPAGALVSTRAPKPSKPIYPKIKGTSAEPGGALVSTRAPKPTFKPEALPKVVKSSEPAGALVRTKAPKPTFNPEALPKIKATSAEPAGALVRTKVPKPTFKPEALPKATKSAEPAGALVSTRAPKPTFKPEALPKAVKSAEPAGALVRTKTPKPTSKTSTSGGGKPPKGGGLTQTVRATLSPAEKTGNMKYPGLEKYATGSSSSGGPSKSPISSLSRNLKTAGIVGAAAAGTAAVDQGLKGEKRRSDAELRKNIKTNVYNTMDTPSMDKPTGQIRSRLKVGSRKIGSTFDDAFREAKRKEREAKRIGDPVKATFTYGGKEYSTKMKEENLINYLLDGGFATDEKSAEAIISVMSEEWIQNIIEQSEV